MYFLSAVISSIEGLQFYIDLVIITCLICFNWFSLSSSTKIYVSLLSILSSVPEDLMIVTSKQ